MVRLMLTIVLLLTANLVLGSPLNSTENRQQQQQASQSSTQATPSTTTTTTTTDNNGAAAAIVNDDQLIAEDSLPVVTESSLEQTSVKKELQATTSVPVVGVPEVLSQLTGEMNPELPAMIVASAQQVAGQSSAASPVQVNMSPQLSKSMGDMASQLTPDLMSANFERVIKVTNSSSDSESIDSLLPKGTSLFKSDAIDVTQLSQMDCHLRNVDYCLAGLAGSSAKLLPETSDELEVRCDEMKATTSCLAVYNKRCQTFKIFSLLAPFAANSDNLPAAEGNPLIEQQRALIKSASSDVHLSPQFQAQLMGSSSSSSRSSLNNNITLGNLMEFCEPEAANSQINAQLRQRIFTLAKCINARIPKLNPCLEDLKTALQVFYEPKRTLPLRPTCCALGRFRSCSSSALDKVCGLSSFQQLVESFSSSSSSSSSSPGTSPMAMLSSIDRICRQSTDHKSAYCVEVLPPGGMRAPQRRGPKASKLAKALDLFSFSPATQDFGSLEG